MIAHDGMYLDFAKEAASGLDDTEQQHCHRNANCRVDAVLDAGEDCDEDSGEKDDDFQRGDAPELVHGIGRGD